MCREALMINEASTKPPYRLEAIRWFSFRVFRLFCKAIFIVVFRFRVFLRQVRTFASLQSATPRRMYYPHTPCIKIHFSATNSALKIIDSTVPMLEDELLSKDVDTEEEEETEDPDEVDFEAMDDGYEE